MSTASAANIWARRVLHDMPVDSSESLPPRLPEIVRQLNLGIHVEDWREDLRLPEKDFSPQHSLRGLKRDRNNIKGSTTTAPPRRLPQEMSESCPTSVEQHTFSVQADQISRIDLDGYGPLRSPPVRKRRRTSLTSFTNIATLAQAADIDRSSMDLLYIPVEGHMQDDFSEQTMFTYTDPRLDDRSPDNYTILTPSSEHDWNEALLADERAAQMRSLMKYKAESPEWFDPPPFSREPEHLELDFESAFHTFIDFTDDRPVKAKI